jgi:2,3-bisphosphoglycerate-dependent phosphoglycerate mutase
MTGTSTTDLILLRHGESEWNRLNLFTGWYDCDLTDTGREEAAAAGPLIAEAGLSPRVLHTSLQTRAIRTAQLALDEMGLLWLPVRRSWRLNERHYGDLTGKNKAETTAQYGEDQVKVWRRSYDVPPPPISADNPSNPNADPQYAELPPDVLPLAECLADVVARMLPWWFDAIVTDLRAHGTVLVVAHGNSLRALVKHLDGISDDDITELNIPTGVPLHYELGADFRPLEAKPTTERYLGDPAAIAAKAAAVAAQASATA